MLTTREIKATIKDAIKNTGRTVTKQLVMKVWHNYMSTPCGHEIDLENAMDRTFVNNAIDDLFGSV